MDEMIGAEEAAAKYRVALDALIAAIDESEGPIGIPDGSGRVVLFDDDNLRAWVERENRTLPRR